MADAVRALADDADVLVAAERLPVHNRVRSLRMPGAKVSSGVRTASGSVVVLPGRLLASIGTYVILDIEFLSVGGRQELALAEDGLRISFDVATVLSNGSGSAEVHDKLPLDQSVLRSHASAGPAGHAGARGRCPAQPMARFLLGCGIKVGPQLLTEVGGKPTDPRSDRRLCAGAVDDFITVFGALSVTSSVGLGLDSLRQLRP